MEILIIGIYVVAAILFVFFNVVVKKQERERELAAEEMKRNEMKETMLSQSKPTPCKDSFYIVDRNRKTRREFYQGHRSPIVSKEFRRKATRPTAAELEEMLTYEDETRDKYSSLAEEESSKEYELIVYDCRSMAWLNGVGYIKKNYGIFEDAEIVTRDEYTTKQKLKEEQNARRTKLLDHKKKIQERIEAAVLNGEDISKYKAEVEDVEYAIRNI